MKSFLSVYCFPMQSCPLPPMHQEFDAELVDAKIPNLIPEVEAAQDFSTVQAMHPALLEFLASHLIAPFSKQASPLAPIVPHANH